MSILLKLFLTSAFLLGVSTTIFAVIFGTYRDTPENFQKVVIAACWATAAFGCSLVINWIWS